MSVLINLFLCRETLQKDVEEMREKLQKVLQELEGFKAASSPQIEVVKKAGEETAQDAVAKTRSWNKRLVGNMQDVSVQLEHEIQQRKELEEFKVNFELQMQDVRKKIRDEGEARYTD